MLNPLLRDDCGAIVSMEIVLIVTIAVLAIVVGWSEVAIALNTELNDVGNAAGALNQEYSFSGYHSEPSQVRVKPTSSASGSTFEDKSDDCDKNLSCDLICGGDSILTSER